MILRVNQLCRMMAFAEARDVDRATLAYSREKQDIVCVQRFQSSSGFQTMVVGGIGRAFLAHLQKHSEEEIPADLLPSRDSLIALILDRVLEVRAGNTFLSGAAGASLMGVDFHRCDPSSPVERLSRAALVYAQALHINDASVVARRLYAYNRLPMRPSRRSELQAGSSLHTRLVMEAGTDTRRILDNEWRSSRQTGAWTHYRLAAEMSDQPRTHKLYLSPQPGFCGYVFGETLRVFTEMRVPSFKIPSTEAGLLRPDKFVAYVNDRTQQNRVAQRLVRLFQNLPAHGVPFTAACGSTAVVSWGIDPPKFDSGTALQATSWRSWVTERLGAAIVDAQANLSTLCEPWQFAEERLRCCGINPHSWVPERLTGEYGA